MERWLERLDKLLSIIKPKAYNVIAKSIIGLGLALLAESQFNIIQSVVVAIFEKYFGYSEVLRSLISGGSNPAIGLILIIIGSTYHYLMTVGKKSIELKLSELPEIPDLNFELHNSDCVPYSGTNIYARGCLVNVPEKEKIPEYKVNFDLPNLEGLSNILNSVGNMQRNPSYYKERAEFLKSWGGSELLFLKISNTSKAIATGVKIQVQFPRKKGISADNTDNHIPLLPTSEGNGFFNIPNNLTVAQPINNFDIKAQSTHSKYSFIWNINNLQGNTEKHSETAIFIRAEESFEINFTIFCDQFPNPINKILHFHNSKENVSISTDDLKSDNSIYNEIVDRCIMDGYVKRATEKMATDYEHKTQEILPY